VKHVYKIGLSAMLFATVLLLSIPILCAVSFFRCHASGPEPTIISSIIPLAVIFTEVTLVGSFVAGALLLGRAWFPYNAFTRNLLFNVSIGCLFAMAPPALFSVFVESSIHEFPLVFYLPFIFGGAIVGMVVWKLCKLDEPR
jgi:hypothetical protein